VCDIIISDTIWPAAKPYYNTTTTPLERKNECPRVEYPPWVLTHCHQPTPLYPLGSKGYIATLMIRSIITGRYLPKPPPLFPPSTVVVVICSIEWSERGSCHSSTADPPILIYTHWINHLKKNIEYRSSKLVNTRGYIIIADEKWGT
jgi:hypothetical protein